MSYKYFYLLVLILVSINAIMIFVLMYFKLKTHKLYEISNSSNAILYISFAYISWSIVVFSKFFDVEDFNLKLIINDRIFSSLSNLFFVISVIYFPGIQAFVKSKFNITSEKWKTSTIIIFLFLLSILVVLDKFIGTYNFLQQYIVIIDGLVSVIVIFILGFFIRKSYKYLFKYKFFDFFLVTTIIGFSISQILLPLTKLFPEQLVGFYPYFLAFFLTFLIALTQLFYLFFSLLLFSEFKHENSLTIVNEFSLSTEFKEIKAIELDYSLDDKLFIIKITGLLEVNEHKIIDIKIKKITQPILYWFLFSLGKSKNIKLYHSDMAVLKFRMVDFWNKNSLFKISQEVLFLNDNSTFEFNTNNVVIKNDLLDNFLSRITVKELIKKHFICFIDYQIIKDNNLHNKKNFEVFCENNFESFYAELKIKYL